MTTSKTAFITLGTALLMAAALFVLHQRSSAQLLAETPDVATDAADATAGFEILLMDPRTGALMTKERRLVEEPGPDTETIRAARLRALWSVTNPDAYAKTVPPAFPEMTDPKQALTDILNPELAAPAFYASRTEEEQRLDALGSLAMRDPVAYAAELKRLAAAAGTAGEGNP